MEACLTLLIRDMIGQNHVYYTLPTSMKGCLSHIATRSTPVWATCPHMYSTTNRTQKMKKKIIKKERKIDRWPIGFIKGFIWIQKNQHI